MKPVIALAAGAIAALLAGRPDPTSQVQARVAQLETLDILIADAGIGTGHTVSAQDLRWQTWPAATAGPAFIRYGMTTMVTPKLWKR